jgi:nucleotide-binding universal stress UspA family protein
MKTILAPVDFSPATERVCAAAADLAKAVRGHVVLLHSVPPPIITTEYAPMVEDIAAITAASEKAAARRLARLVEGLRRRRIKVGSVQCYGAPVAHILEQADSLGADYIVIGSHGHTALYDLLAGSTAHGVLRKAPCPVVIIPPVMKPARKVRKK